VSWLLASGGNIRFPEAGGLRVYTTGLVTGYSDRFYQFWYGDAAAFCTSATFNTTNALKVLWRS